MLQEGFDEELKKQQEEESTINQHSKTHETNKKFRKALLTESG